MKITLVSAVNDERILKSCLQSSPDLSLVHELILQRGFGQAAAAYNDAMARATGDIVVFLHQDVYLPEGWLNQMLDSLTKLSSMDPDWGVAGAFGITQAGERHGHLYCTANQAILGRPFDMPTHVSTLDEVLLVVRKASGLRFDENLKGFHFYGTELCLTARKMGMKCYAVPGFFVHNANEYGSFPASFWEGYRFESKKWLEILPVKTPCVDISRSPWPLLRQNLLRRVRLAFRRKPLARRVAEPAKLYEQLLSTGMVRAYSREAASQPEAALK